MALRDLQGGELVSGEFVVIEKTLHDFRNKPGRYLALVLADETGQIDARLWDNAESTAKECTVGEVVFVQGAAEKYREKIQIKVAKIEARPEAETGKFVPALEAEKINRFAEQMKAIIASVEDGHLRGLLEKIFNESDTWERFLSATAAVSLHSAYAGGLLEHTVHVASLCEEICKLYSQINRNVLITAALLHDIGKLDTFELKGAKFDYTEAGNLVGEPVLGERRVNAAIEELPDFPKEYRLLLSHLLLSHHGEREFGAPIVPQTLEAMVLHHVDNLEAKANGVISIMQRESDPEKVWSEYNRTLERRIYLPRLELDDNAEECD